MTDIDSLITELVKSDEGVGVISDALESPEIKDKLFIPNAGPQTKAYFSQADILLYGGAGGGGKSALINGLALNEHDRSLIIRKQFTDLQGLIDTAKSIVGSGDGFVGGNRPIYRKPDGGVIHYEGYGDTEDISGKQGTPHDFIGVDEAAQLPEPAVRLLMGWLRTTKKGQRCRMILASNPPLDTVGDWLIQFFAPWLDEKHPNPAKEGELRWFITDADGNDIEVESGESFLEIDGEKYYPLSRTFISARVEDNPFLDDKYKSTLNSLPEPFRSALRDGNFMNARQDDDWQLIPTEWIRLAQERWKEHGRPVGVPMCAMGVDCVRGGADKMIISPRYDGWYDELIAYEGKDVPDGQTAAALVMKHRRDGADVILDVVGVGSSPLDQLTNNAISATPYNGGSAGHGRTVDKAFKFGNKRAMDYVKFKEALDPTQDGGSPIMLPPDRELLSDLASVRIKNPDMMGGRGIMLEAKEDIKKRLGRSTDKGDAVVMAWSVGNKVQNIKGGWSAYNKSAARPNVVLGHQAKRNSARR